MNIYYAHELFDQTPEDFPRSLTINGLFDQRKTHQAKAWSLVIADPVARRTALQWLATYNGPGSHAHGELLDTAIAAL